MGIEGFEYNKIDCKPTINKIKIDYARRALEEIGNISDPKIKESVRQSITSFIASVVDLLDGEKDDLVKNIKNCLAKVGKSEEKCVVDMKEIKKLQNDLDKSYPHNLNNNRSRSNNYKNSRSNTKDIYRKNM